MSFNGDNGRRLRSNGPAAAALLVLISSWSASKAKANLFEDAVAGEVDAADADASGGSPESSPSPAGSALELNGYVRGTIFAGKTPEKDSAQIKSAYGEPALKMRIRKGEYGDAYGEIRFRAGNEEGETATHLDLREAYVNTYLGPFDFRLGHQVIMWGRADGTNPTNNLTPRDMRIRSPLEDDARLANFALRAHLNLDPLRLEPVWVPFYAPSHFPRFDLPDNISMGDPDYPDTNLKKGIYAGRAHILLPSFEFSLSYLYGYSTFPGIALKDVVIEPAAPPDITLALSAYPHHVAGADFSTSFGSIGLRGEFAYRHPVNYEALEERPLPELQYVVGVDHEFYGQLNVIVQYWGKYIFDWNELEPLVGPPDLEAIRSEVIQRNRMISSQLEEIQHSGTLRIEWKLLQETLSLEVLSMYNFSTEELLLFPKIAYDIIDDLKLTAGAQIYMGPDRTLFGTIEESQSAVYLELKASF